VPHNHVNSVHQALYLCSPFRDLVIQSMDISAPLLLAAVSQQTPPTLPTANPILPRRQSEQGKTAPDIPCSTPQPSSSPQRPRTSGPSPLSALFTRSFPGIQLIRVRLHHVRSSTSFAMGMSTSMASCIKTRTSFSSRRRHTRNGTIALERPSATASAAVTPLS
jgi:hypothetical protein